MSLTQVDAYSPPETRLFAAQFRKWCIVVGFVWVAVFLFLRSYPIDRPVERVTEVEHFYYGSIGSDRSSGLPVEIIRVLPVLFPQHLPVGAPRDLTAFGFIQEPGEVLPIGFSIRNQFVERTQINCGTCHTGTVRTSADADPVIVPGMPAVTVDLHSFFQFLFDVARDDGFTGDAVVEAIEANTDLNWLDRLIYRIAVDRMREQLQAREIRNAFIFADDYTRFLPGRVNTFDTFKVEQFRHFYEVEGVTPTRDEMFGIVDFPSVWNQAPRDGLWLHWDGNQSSVRERNFSAAMGGGTLPHEMDIDALFRIEDYLSDLPAPEYPFPVDAELVAQGEQIYMAQCAECHDFGAALLGQTVPLDEIGTDPHRAWSYTDTIRRAQIDFTSGHFWQFRNFREIDGYATQPLDGIWARAPYLHNGSVPSMWELLTPEERPTAFEVGVDIYDPKNMGWQVARLGPSDPYSGPNQILDTRAKGNASTGHSYGSDLGDAEKWALIEYLKTK
ncbi:MAG: cytochrome c [Pseudomonadota bacterium]